MLLSLGKDGASASVYAVLMTRDDVREATPELGTVARNLATLMRWKDWNQSELARRSEVSQRHISDILRGRSDCTTEMADQLAAAFGFRGWQLMLPDITEELLTSTDLRILVETYIKNPRGRKLIDAASDMVRNSDVQGT